MDECLEKLARIVPSERILLLPHCLRHADSCRAKYDRHGLQCAGCNPDCSINKLRAVALRYGYRGVCVAPGGRLAVQYVQDTRPRAIVAVACGKELQEGEEGVRTLLEGDDAPLIVRVPLSKDGCVDTEVDDVKATEVIAIGCPVQEGKHGTAS
jgi:hypothetical protein